MIGALRWITYINPLRYGFAGVMVNEFHTLKGACANLVPSGPGYDDLPLANKVCASVGARPGEDVVDGSAFVKLSYGYSYSELWRVSTFMTGRDPMLIKTCRISDMSLFLASYSLRSYSFSPS